MNIDYYMENYNKLKKDEKMEIRQLFIYLHDNLRNKNSLS